MTSTTRALLLTDVVDSTALLEALGDERMAHAWAAHDRAARDLLARHRGREIDKSDGFLLLFEGAADAAAYALDYHRAIARVDPPLRARAGLHVGAVTLTENSPADVALGAKPLEVDGLAKPLAARIMALGLGGQTLLSEAARDALGGVPDGCELRSHGHYRLKGMTAPLEVFELGVRGQSPFEPPPDAPKGYRVVRAGDLWRPAREVKHSLPAEGDAFVGRAAELQDLAARLDDGERLVTVLGMGGSGKTRLVRRYGWTWMGDWPGGVYFCDLSEARTIDGLVAAVAGALEVALDKEDPVVQLGHSVAGRGKCLVILDNFEQVTEHAPATLGRWLSRAREATFVVTSREILGIPGEHVMPLEPLPAEGGVELFVVRARARNADFALTAANAPAVQAVVNLLDGLPLAIELAAARSAVLTPDQLLVRLKDRFRLLVGARGGQARQAALRTAIDWSWTLLSPWEQAALAQASAFVGGFTLEAAESVLDLSGWPEAPMPLDVVQSLVDKSLFRTWMPSAGQRLAIDEPYFGMYMSIQEYASEKLRTDGALPDGASGAGPELATMERHGRFYARLGTEETLRALDAHGGVARRRAMAVEIENLVSACRRAIGRGDVPTAVATFAAAASVLALHGPSHLTIELAHRVLALDSLGPAERGRLLPLLGGALRQAGRADDALRCVEEALAICQRSGDRDREALVRANLGRAYVGRGRVREALQQFHEALAITRAAGHRGDEAVVLGGLGNAYWSQGHMGEALPCLVEALALHRDTGNRRLEGLVLAEIGNLHWSQGRVTEALQHDEEALAIHREVGNRPAEANALVCLGVLHAHQGQKEAARRRYEEALTIHRETGGRLSEGSVHCNLAILHYEDRRIDDALRHFQEALVIHREVGDRRGEANVLGNLGNLHWNQGRTDEALRHFEEALVIHREVGDRRFEGITLGNLGTLHADNGRWCEAREALAAGESLVRAAGDRLNLGVLLGQRGEIECCAGDLPAARAYLAQAESIARDLGVSATTPLAVRLAKLRADLGGTSDEPVE